MKQNNLLITVFALALAISFSLLVLHLYSSSKISPVKTIEDISPIRFVHKYHGEANRSAKYIQLRHFIINRGKMDEFVDAWLKGVYPLRLKHGFKIEGAWIVKGKNEFFWILTYDGPETFEAKDSAYYASAGRTKLQPDPAQYIAKSQQYFLTQLIPQ